ncbi:hypothetical protein EDC04DRAFT_2676910, partial [Pisolithus marmoratus]
PPPSRYLTNDGQRRIPIFLVVPMKQASCTSWQVECELSLPRRLLTPVIRHALTHCFNCPAFPLISLGEGGRYAGLLNAVVRRHDHPWMMSTEDWGKKPSCSQQGKVSVIDNFPHARDRLPPLDVMGSTTRKVPHCIPLYVVIFLNIIVSVV